MSHHVAMEQEHADVTHKKNSSSLFAFEEDTYDGYHVFTAFDSDLKLHNKDQIFPDRITSKAPSVLSDLDFSLPSTDLDDLESRIFGKVKNRPRSRLEQNKSGRGAVKELLHSQSQGKRTDKISEGDAKRFIHSGDSDPEDHVFHPEIVPFEPSKEPVRQNPADPRHLLDKDRNTPFRTDPSTARYLKILIPQRDTKSLGDRSSSETSTNLFESLSTSAAERLLLESPTDSPSHFRQAQLRLDTHDSEAETLVLASDLDSSFGATSTPKQLPFSKHSFQQSVTTSGKPSGEFTRRNFDFEVYSEKELAVSPLPIRSMEGIQSEARVSKARSELEKSFGGGDEFINSHSKPTQSPANMSVENFNTLANTSDALALQKSVVSDSSVKPASMDEIAALLDSVQKGQYQRNQSLNSTLQSMEDNSSLNDISYDKKYNSMSSLDETPSRIPADYTEPSFTPAAMNGSGPSEHIPSAEEGGGTAKLGMSSPQPSEGQQAEVNYTKKVKTVQKRPTSLLAQNTTLAISSAIAHKYHVPPQEGMVSPTGPVEAKLYRSPIEAITTAKGGRIATMEGQKAKPKKKKGKKGGRKSAMAGKLVSDTDTEPPSDTDSIASYRSASGTGDGRLHEVSAGGSINLDEIDSLIIPETTQATSTTIEGSLPSMQNGDILSLEHQIENEPINEDRQENNHEYKNGQTENAEEDYSATLPPETSTESPTVPETMSTSTPETKLEQHAAKPSQPKAEASSGSYLGSFFSWGRQAEKPDVNSTSTTAENPTTQRISDNAAHENSDGSSKEIDEGHVNSSNVRSETPVIPSNIQTTSSANQNEPDVRRNRDEDRGSASKEHDRHGDSMDSGVDFVRSPNDVVQRPEPISSSTPHASRTVGRTDHIVSGQDAPSYSHPAPTQSSVQASSAPAVPYSSRNQPVDMGRRYNPVSRSSGYQPSRYMPPLGGQQDDGEDLQTVLREKAKLEGQLEMLMSESESALQARTQLQSQVAILQAKLKAQGSGGDGSSHNRSALENEITTLKESRGRLEDTINRLQVEIDSKEADLEGLRRELQVSETANRKIQTKLEEVKKEIGNRETAISQMKDKMAAMQGQVDQAKQEQSSSVAKVRSLETDVESLTKARDWFKEQLGFAQDVRNQLQAELSSSQTKTASQASTIESLKTENTKVKQQLTEARHRMFQEKEQIAKHLETIEADIVTREATFSAMQREKTAVQQAVFAQMDQMEEEKYRLAGLVASASELERQLEVAKQELEAKHAALVGIEVEKRELVKGLALAEEALAARTTEMIALQDKCDNVEKKLREEQGKSLGQDNEVRQLRADKALLESALVTANEEKRSFDESIQKLRGDLSRVETSFKQMRQELGVKSSQLEETEMEGQQLKELLKDQEKQLDAQQANLEASIAAIGNKDAIIDDLVKIRDQLEGEIASLKKDVVGARSSYQGFMEANSGLQGELSRTREAFKELDQQLQETLAENANLQGRLESLSEEHKQFAELMEENSALRQRVADTQSTMHREIADQKTSALRLGADLNNVQKELKEKEQVYEATIQALTKQLEDASVERDRVEKELYERTEAVTQMSKEEQQKMLHELQGIKQDADVLRVERNRLNTEVQHLRRKLQDETEEYRNQVDDLEAEVQELRDVLEQQRRNELNNRSLALDLERERGRLAGVHQSHSALKQHTGMLENALAQRETAVAELTEELNATSQDKTSENMRLQKQLKEIGVALEKEKELSQDIRKQLAGDKGDNSKLRQDLQNLSLDTQEVRGQMKQKEDQIAALNAELARLKQNEEQEKNERDNLHRELEVTKSQTERLARLLHDKDSQGPVLQDQMKTLAWQNEQKSREAESLKEQLYLAESRQQIELDGVKASLTMTNEELAGLKKELASTRKEKFAFQAKLSQLKSALQATLQQNKLLKAKLKSRSRVAATLGKQSVGAEGAAQGDGGKGLAEEIVVPEIAYDVESLLNSDVVEGVSASQSRPLHAIQSCLQSIKDEMGALDAQMREHTAAVNTSSEAWKEVGDRVRDLRRASADPVAPSPSFQLPHSISNGAEPPPNSTPSQAQRGSNTRYGKQPMVYDL